MVRPLYRLFRPVTPRVSAGLLLAVLLTVHPAGSGQTSGPLPAGGTGEPAESPRTEVRDDSGFTLAVYSDSTAYNYPRPIDITASLSRREPVSGARVTLSVRRPDGRSVDLILRDDGTRGDRSAGDGLYSGIFGSFSGNGSYDFTITACGVAGVTREGSGFSELPQGARSGGDGRDPAIAAPFRLTAVVRRRVQNWRREDLVPPGRIDSFFLERRTKSAAYLTWLAPGGDMYSGRAARYEMRRSVQPISTEADWTWAVVISIPLRPRQSGATERFAMHDLPRGQRSFLALRAYDKSGNISSLSNTVLVDMP